MYRENCFAVDLNVIGFVGGGVHTEHLKALCGKPSYHVCSLVKKETNQMQAFFSEEQKSLTHSVPSLWPKSPERASVLADPSHIHRKLINSLNFILQCLILNSMPHKEIREEEQKD